MLTSTLKSKWIVRLATAALAIPLCGCASSRGSGALRAQRCIAPDAQLAKIIRSLDELQASCGPDSYGEPSCDRVREDLLRLTVVCPDHEPTLFADAILAYDVHKPADAQEYLDLILSRSGSHPEAAVLRARIASEEGNLPYARRMLEQQVKLAPDHAGLHETLGGMLYLAKDWANATRELTTAGALGSPRWRIAYHLGLVEEAQGHVDNARRLYMESFAANPQWRPAQSRLTGLPPA
jgi:predicted Zn-dependent protease